MPKKEKLEEQPARQSNLLIIAAAVVLGIALIYLVGRPSSPPVIEPGDPTLVVPIQADPTEAAQSGQPLISEQKSSQSQSLQQTQQSPQPSQSNLQGSPSTQSAAPLYGVSNPSLTP